MDITNKLTQKLNTYHWKWRDKSIQSKIKSKKLVYFNEQLMLDNLKKNQKVEYTAYPTEWVKLKPDIGSKKDNNTLAIWQGGDKTVVAWVGRSLIFAKN